MKTRIYTNSKPVLARYYDFWWEFRERKNLMSNETYCEVYRGPLCGKKSCKGTMEEVSECHFECMKCGEQVDIDIPSSRLQLLVKEAFYADERKKITSVINLDKLPAINEKMEEENKYYSVSIEHDKVGNPKDIHILVGRKDNGGKHAHIILSPNGELRLDKKNLDPKEEGIKSITSVIYEEDSQPKPSI